jgi:hypothetical protein
MLPLNEEQTKQLADIVVKLCEEYPHAVYLPGLSWDTCGYDYGDVVNGPDDVGCVVGQAARLMGIDIALEDLNGYESVDAFTADCPERDLLRYIQARQDAGWSWGRAWGDYLVEGDRD